MARGGAPIGTVVWAHRQEEGRGRLGRSFSSPVGGVYISMLVPSPSDPKDIGFALTAKAGVAVKRAIRDVCGVECGIKWVNDIVLDGLKVCGLSGSDPGYALSGTFACDGVSLSDLRPGEKFYYDIDIQYFCLCIATVFVSERGEGFEVCAA